MPVHLSRLSGLLRLLALCLVLFLPAGCAGTQAPDASIPRLSSVSLPEGGSVHVVVTGQDPPASDMAPLVSAYLQSECNLRIADSPRDADAVVRLHIRDIFVSGTSRRIAEPGAAFSRGAVGTMLGATVGSLAGGRSGALWGAVGGAALGLGVAASETGGSNNIWAMKTDVEITSGGKPATPEEVVVQAPPARRKEDALPALEDALARAVVRAFQSPRHE